MFQRLTRRNSFIIIKWSLLKLIILCLLYKGSTLVAFTFDAPVYLIASAVTALFAGITIVVILVALVALLADSLEIWLKG
jgi:tetrahydromethanopterin S-methyltransferase subunit B